MKLKALIFLSLLTVLFACKKEDNDLELPKCDSSVILDSNLYQTANDSNFTIENALIHENCLYIEFYSSGCSGDTWEINLYDSEVEIPSFPPSRNLRLSLINNEACQAVFKKVISFDLTPLQTDSRVLTLYLSQGYFFTYEY